MKSAPKSASDVVFVVPGLLTLDPTNNKQTVTLSAASRSAGAAPQALHRLSATPGQDTVALSLQDGSGRTLRLVLHPDNAKALLLSQQGRAQRGMTNTTDGEVEVPLAARWNALGGNAAASRSGVGDLVFAALEIIGASPKKALVTGTVIVLGGLVDGQVKEGVYALNQGSLGSLRQATAVDNLPASAQPMLVLIHGTASSTAGSFGQWWQNHPALIRRLFERYENQVFALDHATLGRSPIANALTLALALPKGARLHLVTHSRGGLVAEVLARACGGMSKADTGFFEAEGYAGHKQALDDLAKALQGKNIRVERIVRVACPAHGTHLASGRLDAYFSVLEFLLERAGVPVLPELVDFMGEVARRRTSPSELPGLEAMLPGGPVVQWLNSPSAPLKGALAGELRVVAGDVQPSLFNNWLRSLMALAVSPIFQGDNDLVVDTSAMYGGAERAGSALFLLESSPETDHFSYFTNALTANAICNALLDDLPAGFARIGPLSKAGQSASGSRNFWGASQSGPPPWEPKLDDGSRPAVVVLPGIMGSHLYKGTQKEWFALTRLFGVVNRIAWSEPNITAKGSAEDYYHDLLRHLEASHHVVEFAYDWRAPLADSAAKLAEQMDVLLDKRGTNGPPVRILAHSMGGLVARVMGLTHVSTWNRWLAHDQARFVMLGTPNAGSWAPMSVFTGDDSLGRLISTVGGWFAEFKARQEMAKFAGFVQLCAGLNDAAQPLGDRAVWQRLAEADEKASRATPWDSQSIQGFYEWAIPSRALLTDAQALHAALASQAAAWASAGPGLAKKISLVIGQSSKGTACGLTVGTDGALDYAFTQEGDGRVPWASTLMAGVPAWRVDAEHGDLCAASAFFGLYSQLLAGNAPATSQVRSGGARGGSASAAATVNWRGRPRDQRQALPTSDAQLRDALFNGGWAGGWGSGTGTAPRSTPLAVEVMHGDLKYVQHALLVGHSRALELTGSEHVLNKLLNGALQDALRSGLYPVEIGDSLVFGQRSGQPQPATAPPTAIVIGLGSEGQLKPGQLQTAVRLGVLNHARQAAAASADALPAYVLAVTSIGSGGAMSVGESVAAVVQGVIDANAVIANAQPPLDWPPVAKLRIIELFESRAAEAWHALADAQQFATLTIALQGGVTRGHGGFRQPLDINYRGTSYDLVCITQGVAMKSNATSPNDTQEVLEYSLSTRRARAEVRAKGNQRALVGALVKLAEANSAYDAALARTLYQLLVPLELRTYLGTSRTLVLELDANTASYPWEMLDDIDPMAELSSLSGRKRPLGLRPGGAVLRRFRTREFRELPRDSLGREVLVVGASKLAAFGGIKLNPLPGVALEVAQVEKLLEAAFSVTPLLDQDFDKVIKPLLTRSWKVLHLSGHGLYEPGGQSGMLIADGLVLGPAEIESMDTVPELVFVNCCSLGKLEADSRQGHHGQLAANLAEQLINIGVRCVVAAGWAVDDDAAAAFADGFYRALTGGQSFDVAVGRAREAAWIAAPLSHTWAAYQCYGDPSWRLVDGQSTPQRVTSEHSAIATADELRLHIEAVAVQAKGASADKAHHLADTLKQLVQRSVHADWLAQGQTAETLANAWRELKDTGQAIAWYDRALAAADGGASQRARERRLEMLAADANTTAKQLTQVIAEISALIAQVDTPERQRILRAALARQAAAPQAARPAGPARARKAKPAG